MKFLTILIFSLFQISCSQSLNLKNTLTNHILFEGIENKLKIANLKNQDNYYLEINDSLSFIYNIGCDCFPITISKVKKTEVIVNIIKNNKTKNSVTFQTEKIPQPTLFVNRVTQSDKVIKKEKLMTLVSIKAIGLSYTGNYKVNNFALEIIISGRLTTIKSNSENFTNIQKQAILNLNRGSKLTLRNIEVEFPNKEIIKVAPFSLRII